MALLTVTNLRHAYGTQVVLDGATLSVEPGEKLGLVGRNGQGKTTLMRVLTGALSPDGGDVQVQRGARVGYLSQDPDLDPDDTVRLAAERAFAELHALHVTLNEVFEAMASADADELDRLMKQQSRLEAAIEAAGGYAIDHRIDAMLHGLGFTDDQFSKRVGVLSGGQKGRLALAQLLLEAPDLLLLDEPTNHLDIAGREWLEDFLADEYRGAVIVVSHDRWLLNRVVGRIVEVEAGVIREYPGNYDGYMSLRLERQLTQSRVYEKQQDRIRQEEAFIRKYKAGQRARQAKGRESRLDRYKRDELVDRPIELDVMRLNLPTAPRSGDQVAVAEGISKAYGDLTLFADLDLSISRGERIGIIGPNGTGKTTLIRCLLGETEPDAGDVRLGTRLEVGYYSQLHEDLDLSLNVWQYLQQVIVSKDGGVRASEQQARDLAGAFLFSGAEQDKALGDLSGGERSRAVIAGLVSSAKNLLVLDEPTNHLDIPSAERLEQTLTMEGGYDGTMLLISHDRTLLQATCTKLIVFEGASRVRVFDGTYGEWVDRAAREKAASRAEAEARTVATRKAEREKAAKQPRPATKVVNKLARLKLQDLEAEIESKEAEIRAIDARMVDPAVYTDGAKTKALQADREAAVAALEPLEMEWARRAEDD